MTIDVNNYGDLAEKAIKTLKSKTDRNGRPVAMITTSKLRNILSMTADIYNDVLLWQQEQLPEDIISRISYLKIRIVYEIGRDDQRDKPVKAFFDEAKILKYIGEIKNSRSNFILFNRYMEALVAYHKFYDGRDN